MLRRRHGRAGGCRCRTTSANGTLGEVEHPVCQGGAVPGRLGDHAREGPHARRRPGLLLDQPRPALHGLHRVAEVVRDARRELAEHLQPLPLVQRRLGLRPALRLCPQPVQRLPLAPRAGLRWVTQLCVAVIGLHVPAHA